jgi:hypothetical protein
MNADAFSVGAKFFPIFCHYCQVLAFRFRAVFFYKYRKQKNSVFSWLMTAIMDDKFYSFVVAGEK